MTIALYKFGTTLSSHPFGKEAFSALQTQLSDLSSDEKLILEDIEHLGLTIQS